MLLNELTKLVQQQLADVSKTSSGIRHALDKHLYLKQLLLQQVSLNPKIYISPGKLALALLNGYTEKYCLVCGKVLSLKQKNYCSEKCALSKSANPFIKYKTKIETTNLLKYGEKNPFASKKIQTKIKQTNLKKFDVSNPFASKEIQEKIKQTNLKRYAVENPMQNEEIKKKVITTNLIKYQVKMPLQNNEIKQNIQLTNRQKTGYDYLALTTMFNLPNVIPLFQPEEYIGLNKIYKWKCRYCGKQFYARYNNGMVKKKCSCQKLSGQSKEELELVQYCQLFYPNLIHSTFDIIKPYELDIYIPEIQLAIEFNGCYYHSIEANLPVGYHLMKTEMCEQQGIRLIHIWEDDWLNKKDLIKEKLQQVFTNQEKIDYTKVLDRCWYPVKQQTGFKLEIIKPEIIIRNNFHCENCGYLKYLKQS